MYTNIPYYHRKQFKPKVMEISFIDMTSRNIDLMRDKDIVDHDKRTPSGEFDVKCWKHGFGYLFDLDNYDLELIKDVKLKKDEVIFRYETKVMFGKFRPFIKFNLKLKQPRVYFLTKNSFDGIIDEIQFETRGELLNWMNLDWSFEDEMM